MRRIEQSESEMMLNRRFDMYFVVFLLWCLPGGQDTGSNQDQLWYLTMQMVAALYNSYYTVSSFREIEWCNMRILTISVSF